MSINGWARLDHAALLRVVGAERWPLDRLCLDDEAPLACEVERVRAALGRLAWVRGATTPLS